MIQLLQSYKLHCFYTATYVCHGIKPMAVRTAYGNAAIQLASGTGILKFNWLLETVHRLDLSHGPA